MEARDKDTVTHLSDPHNEPFPAGVWNIAPCVLPAFVTRSLRQLDGARPIEMEMAEVWLE